ncbi:MAG TPA: isocitrate/isopropylmalate family dehydrogenase, partial [Verrucomicrobiae bacterium]|nr:isocitrate/isopropylmalate family dehydrogenase [Verrucomicrobiae bacterium]
NPTALILSASLMLRHLGEHTAAARVRRAVETVLTEGKSVTADLGGGSSTGEMAAAIAARVREGA